MKKKYHVSWIDEVDADNPKEAARLAFANLTKELGGEQQWDFELSVTDLDGGVSHHVTLSQEWSEYDTDGSQVAAAEAT